MDDGTLAVASILIIAAIWIAGMLAVLPHEKPSKKKTPGAGR
jgi:hypothetical protein